MLLTASALGLAAAAIFFRGELLRRWDGLTDGRERKLDIDEKKIVDRWRTMNSNPFDNEGQMTCSEFTINVASANPALDRVVIENVSAEPVLNFWFHREGEPNLYSAKTIVESATRGKGTETEKVLALFDLFLKYYVNFFPVDDVGILRSPSILLGSVGYGQCNYASDALQLLCQIAGCRTRGVGFQLVERGETRIAHNVMEVQADGKWIYLDPDGKLYFTLEDGRIAGVEDLKRNPDIIRKSPLPTSYDKECYARAFEKGEVILYDPAMPFRRRQRYEDMQSFPLLFRKAMRYDLLPGEKIILESVPAGKVFVPGMGCGEKRFDAPRSAPPCAGGRVIQRLTREVRSHLEDFRAGGGLVLPVSAPYIAVGGALRGSSQSTIRYCPFRSFSIYDPTFTSASCAGRSAVQLDELFPRETPIFGYALKLDPARLADDAELVTDIQHNPRALPRLDHGENTFIFYSPGKPSFRVRDCDGKSVVETDTGIRVEFDYH